jgi:hypothetical protein
MSLITNALNRTRDQQGKLPEPASHPAPTSPTPPKPPQAGARPILFVMFAVAMFGAVVVAFGMLRWFTPVEPPAIKPPKPQPVAAVAPFNEERIVNAIVEKLKVEPPPAPPTNLAPVAESLPATPEPPKFVLQGIMADGLGREAMINNMTVREGDEFDGAKVLAIESRRVRLQVGATEVVLRMP